MVPIPSPPYEWDEDKREETLRLRGLDFALVTRIDWRTATHDRQERAGEVRYSSLAILDGRLHNVVWTRRDPYTRIISFRKANDREMARYEREQA